ncbi:MAG: hypothetical protein KAR30_09335, partial [Gammaproteobacteria bacterium]|nr:hypothetical protein [Gammaproteobacteria bacterium]
PAYAAESDASADQGSKSYGRTKRNDTLWKIAKEVRPDESVSLNQAMIGLLRENPEAFMGNNINRLKAGYVLQVPDRTAMTSMSRAEATNEVNQQYREWKNLGRKTSVAKSMDAAAETSAKVLTPKKTAKGRLELLAPKTGDESRAEAGTKIDQNASNEELRRQLAFVRESEEAKSQESAELHSRVLELEEQIENINRLASLKDEQLAALQSKLAELQKGEAQTGAEKKEPVKAEVKQAKPVKQPPSAPQPKQEPGLFDWLDDPVMSGVAGGVILIVLILLAIIAKRRTSTVGFKESILQERAPVAEPSEPPVHINEVLDSRAQEKEESEDKGEEAPPPPSSSYLSDFAVSSIGSMHDEAGEADPLTEADVFLAYGRFQPAEAMINEAIESQPDRSDLRFKLLEIYYAARNESSFEQEATAFQEMVAGDPIWDKVVEMGQDLCPGSVLFGGSGSSSTEPALSDSVEESLSEPEPESDEAVPESLADEQVKKENEEGEVSVGHFSESEFDTKLNSAIEEQPVNDSPIDFDLGDFEVEGDEGRGEVSESEAKSDDNLDFDLSGSEGEQVVDDLASELESMASNLDSESPEGADDIGVASVMDVTDSEQNMDFDLGGETPAIEDLGDGGQVIEDLADDLEAMASSLDTGTDMEGMEKESSAAGVEIPNIDADFEFDTVDSALEDDEDFGDGEDSPLSDEDDEMGTKLDLARAYVDMGDPEGAKNILNEVVEEGDDQQKNEAQELLQKIV